MARAAGLVASFSSKNLTFHRESSAQANTFIAAVGLEEAHGPSDFLIDGMRRSRDAGHAGHAGGDRQHRGARAAAADHTRAPVKLEPAPPAV
jgi:hypothetical protein